jgi:hypothetical protein
MNFLKKVGDGILNALPKSKEVEDTTMFLTCEIAGPVSQAGRPMQGKAKFKIPKCKKEQFDNFKQGVIITGTLYGYEEVYWAKGMQHDKMRGTSIKHMVNGDARRENKRVLTNQQIMVS